MHILKRLIPDVIAVVLFVAISMTYFFAPIRDGKVLTGTDHNAAVGSGREMKEYQEKHNGERTRWTNTIFCGMPTYQMAPSYPSTSTLSTIESVYRLGLPDVAAYVFIMLLGFYIMLRAFDFKAWMAALGAILWAFSSYYFIIIGAGHIWKLLTLAFIPPTIGGVVLCYRGKYLWGIVVTGFFTALQILSNHVQMTYYFGFVMLLMALAYLVEAIRQKQLKQWCMASAAALVGGVMGLSINLSNLYHTYEYSKETMRSKSELTSKTKNAADQTDSGLERSYITQWSYGIGETWTLLVPNAKGGASIPLSMNETAMSKAKPQYTPIYPQVGQYWGEQPGTSGPVYVGALVCFLFVLGLLIVKEPMKWALLAATVLSVLLSWGKNFMPMTDLFLDWVPMYDKFRTVASILVIAEFTMPMLAMLALKRIVDEPAMMQTKAFTRNVGISLALTALPCLLFCLMPDLFFGPYFSTSELSLLQPMVAQGQLPADVLVNIEEMRRHMLTTDALRSLIIILIGVATLMVFAYGKIKAVVLSGILTVVCLFDLWLVDKRYMNDGMFEYPRPTEQSIPMSEADRIIKEDKDPYYRVLNLSSNTFNENQTAYYHNSIGGYHAAKLRRYQELIEYHIAPEMQKVMGAIQQTNGHLEECQGDSLFPVLNMLNTKYLIVGLQDGKLLPVENPHALGNAWYVDNLKVVVNADEEMAALGKTMLSETLVVQQGEASKLPHKASADSTARVQLTSYEANRLSYEADSKSGGVIVFSDIYYPGWTCTVDGKEVEIARANYLLRAISIEPGKHEVVMTFDPQTIHNTETIAYAAMALLSLLFVVLVVVSARRKK